MIFGDGESKMSLLSMSGEAPALHLMPNIQVGTGRYRRSHKYHDKNVDKVWVADNGYMVTVSTGSKFVKIWKVREEEIESIKLVPCLTVKDYQFIRSF